MKSSRRRSIAWPLLFLVCFLWWLDCYTRPAAGPLLGRIGNQLILLSENEADSFLNRAGRWMIEVSSDSNTTYNIDNSATTTINSFLGTISTNSNNSSTDPLVGKWRFVDLRDTSGAIVDVGGYSCVIEFYANGTGRTVNMPSSGSTEMKAWEWISNGSTLYMCENSRWDDNADSVEYTIRSNTLTLVLDGQKMTLTRVQ